MLERPAGIAPAPRAWKARALRIELWARGGPRGLPGPRDPPFAFLVPARLSRRGRYGPSPLLRPPPESSGGAGGAQTKNPALVSGRGVSDFPLCIYVMASSSRARASPVRLGSSGARSGPRRSSPGSPGRRRGSVSSASPARSARTVPVCGISTSRNSGSFHPLVTGKAPKGSGKNSGPRKILHLAAMERPLRLPESS